MIGIDTVCLPAHGGNHYFVGGHCYCRQGFSGPGCEQLCMVVFHFKDVRWYGFTTWSNISVHLCTIP